MFEKITPEQAGISSAYVKKFIERLQKRGITAHSVLMMRGDAIFAEYYWAPFNRDFCHRMYSQTKSYVGIAIGLLVEEGKLSLDDKVISFFPERITCDTSVYKYVTEATVEDLLTMQTAGGPPNWFTYEDNADRVKLYFDKSSDKRPAGCFWEYDSPGSMVLSALVEKLSGMSLLDYLRHRLFNKMGTFRTAHVLKTRNGDSWGDSALLCTARDMASFGRLLMREGNWEGEQLVDAAYVKKATSRICDNSVTGLNTYSSFGYGYQIWRCDGNGFFFNGMGGQFTFCLPDYDILFSCTGDNQGHPMAGEVIFSAFYDLIVENLSPVGVSLAEDPAAYAALETATADLKLRCMDMPYTSDYEERINGKEFICNANASGITRFSFTFEEGDRGVFRYENATGEKELPFGMRHNVFGKFPQLGYSDEFGGTRTTNGFKYGCAVSAAWRDANKLMLRVQIIDRYFGNMTAVFAFKGDEAYVSIISNAEDFLTEYKGQFLARMKQD